MILVWRGELLKLRSAWRDEIRALLIAAPDLHEWQLLRSSTWTRKKREKTIRKHLVPCAEKLRLARVALAVDVCLAWETDSIDRFVMLTAQDEAGEWTMLIDALKQLSEKMGMEHGADVRNLLRALYGYDEAIKVLSISCAVEEHKA